jgi:hypothetical protein
VRPSVLVVRFRRSTLPQGKTKYRALPVTMEGPTHTLQEDETKHGLFHKYDDDDRVLGGGEVLLLQIKCSYDRDLRLGYSMINVQDPAMKSDGSILALIWKLSDVLARPYI